MWTKKIEIKDENHLKEVVKALKSNGEKVHHEFYTGVKSLWYNDNYDGWSVSPYSINSDWWPDHYDVPEYEIVPKTLYELKEVPKIKITCKNCGKTIEFKDSNDMFKGFVVFSGYIDNGDKAIESETVTKICKDCIKKLLEN